MEKKCKARSSYFLRNFVELQKAVFDRPARRNHSQQNDQGSVSEPCRIALTHDERHGAERQRQQPGGPNQDGSKTISVPNVAVTQVATRKSDTSCGDTIYLTTDKRRRTLTTDRSL